MDQLDRYDPDDFDLPGPPFSAPVGGDLLLTIPQEDAVSAALNALGRGSALVLVTGDPGSGRTLVAEVLADALRGRNLVVDEIAQLGGIGGAALLRRLAPLLRIAPERLAPVLAAVASEASGTAARSPAGTESTMPGPATLRRGRAALQHAGRGARDPDAWAPDAPGPDAPGPNASGLDAAGLDTPGLETLRALAQAGARLVEDGQAEPALAGEAEPALAGEAEPALAGEAEPALAGEAEPALAGETEPALAGETQPGLAVLVDDAGTWPTESLLLLASLARPAVRGAPLLQVVLIGDAGLERRLAAMRKAGSAGDPASPVSLRIPSLTLRQGREYLAHRFAAAGGSLERTMSAAAVGEILARCGGNPGRIDRLADDCLALTVHRRRRIVTPAVVRAARQTPPPRSARLSAPAIYALLGATGGVLAAGAGLGLAVHAWAPDTLVLSGNVPARRGAATPSSQAAPAGRDAALFAGAGRFGTPSPADTAASPQGAADRTVESPGLVPAAPPPAVLSPDAPSRPSPASAVRTALAPAPAVPPAASTPFPAFPVAPRVSAPDPAAVTAPPVLLDPVPRSPALATPNPPPSVDAPTLALVPPTVIRTDGGAGLPDTSAPVLSPPAAWPAQPRIVGAPARSASQAVADAPLASPSQAMPPPAIHAPQADVPRYSGPVVMHVARGRDTAAVLLRRIWGQDDATAEALFRSLNPAIDGEGPWPRGTMVAVPQRTRHEATVPAHPHVERARLPVPPAPRPDVIHDNPAGQVKSDRPYFCRSILPRNGAEDAYTRQVCGR